MHVHVTTYNIWVIKEECHHTIWHHSVSEKYEKSKEFNVKFHKKITTTKNIKTSSQRKKNQKKNFTDEVVDVFFMFLCFAISQIFQEFWQVVLIKMSNNNFLIFLFTHFQSLSLTLSFYLKFYSLYAFCPTKKKKLWKK